MGRIQQPQPSLGETGILWRFGAPTRVHFITPSMMKVIDKVKERRYVHKIAFLSMHRSSTRELCQAQVGYDIFHE